MMKIAMPNHVAWILEQLHDAGYEAYIVGGCVRDSLLHKKPHDWDICTSAKPEEILDVFKDQKTIQTGIKYGTGTIVLDHSSNKITTYRIDGVYSDGRHPDNVEYTSALTEDLKRRDFTINAMVYNYDDGLIDPFHGLIDLRTKTLNCVGSACDRFAEDELRRFRAIRFALKYNLQLGNDVLENITLNCGRVSQLSAERIQGELNKIFGLPFDGWRLEDGYALFATLEYLLRAYGIHNINLFIPKVMRELIHTENDLQLRLALWFQNTQGLENILFEQLKYPRRMVQEIMQIRDLLKNPLIIFTNANQKKQGENSLQHETGLTIAQALLFQYDADLIERVCWFYNNMYFEVEWFLWLPKLIRKVDPERRPYRISHLKINGYQLKDIGLVGPEIGHTLRRLLTDCIMQKVNNTYDELLERAKVYAAEKE